MDSVSNRVKDIALYIAGGISIVIIILFICMYAFNHSKSDNEITSNSTTTPNATAETDEPVVVTPDETIIDGLEYEDTSGVDSSVTGEQDMVTFRDSRGNTLELGVTSGTVVGDYTSGMLYLNPKFKPSSGNNDQIIFFMSCDTGFIGTSPYQTHIFNEDFNTLRYMYSTKFDLKVSDAEYKSQDSFGLVWYAMEDETLETDTNHSIEILVFNFTELRFEGAYSAELNYSSVDKAYSLGEISDAKLNDTTLLNEVISQSHSTGALGFLLNNEIDYENSFVTEINYFYTSPILDPNNPFRTVTDYDLLDYQRPVKAILIQYVDINYANIIYVDALGNILGYNRLSYDEAYVELANDLGIDTGTWDKYSSDENIEAEIEVSTIEIEEETENGELSEP